MDTFHAVFYPLMIFGLAKKPHEPSRIEWSSVIEFAVAQNELNKFKQKGIQDQ